MAAWHAWTNRTIVLAVAMLGGGPLAGLSLPMDPDASTWRSGPIEGLVSAPAMSLFTRHGG